MHIVHHTSSTWDRLCVGLLDFSLSDGLHPKSVYYAANAYALLRHLCVMLIISGVRHPDVADTELGADYLIIVQYTLSNCYLLEPEKMFTIELED